MGPLRGTTAKQGDAPVACEPHKLEVAGSIPAPATEQLRPEDRIRAEWCPGCGYYGHIVLDGLADWCRCGRRFALVRYQLAARRGS